MGVSGAVSQNQEYGLVLIHFPVRGATRHAEQQQRLQRISIHAPREGRDEQLGSQGREPGDFNPRSPRGERRFSGRCWADWCDFNPRSPRGERPSGGISGQQNRNFNPRSPRGERLVSCMWLPFVPTISIHAPREGSDKPLSGHDFFRLQHFNPRSPRGERHSVHGYRTFR